MGSKINLMTKDGATIGAYRADPSGTPKGGVVVVQEIFGVNPHIRAVTDRFADVGYTAIAPALFDRDEPGVELAYDAAGMKRGMEIVTKIPQEQHLASVLAAVDVLKQEGPVAVVGFCLGGTLAFAASIHSTDVSAAVGYYGGGIASMVGPTPHCPVELHFGEKDDHIPMSDVDKIKAAYPGVPIYTYPAGHGFNCDARGSYAKPSAESAWARTLAFLSENLSKA